jgi:GNAT superfamily N-acetyltransferase
VSRTEGAFDTAQIRTRIDVLSAVEYEAAIPALGALLVDAVEGGAGVNFLTGVTQEQTAGWWRDRLDAVRDGTITAFVARHSTDPERIVGSTILIRSTNPNSPHRAEIGKVLVHRSARRQGLGRALMETVESAARAEGRWLLILDTQQGSAAESMYLALGWTPFGVVPNHAMLVDGTLSDTTYFWKDLR